MVGKEREKEKQLVEKFKLINSVWHSAGVGICGQARAYHVVIAPTLAKSCSHLILTTLNVFSSA